ncbi:hypothetical protein Cgig2_025087 [Carnegiea gigantea]|uniref:Uncharacterized protein n=1 Tax=Carnegiea gigantea TaxID=171969 RepID=A0A9Q1KGW1_9CARY|nr:hypothetical protein Cgig2_025087 [Carnegiea gigantea]
MVERATCSQRFHPHSDLGMNPRLPFFLDFGALVFYNTARYYQAYYGHKTARIIFLFFSYFLMIELVSEVVFFEHCTTSPCGILVPTNKNKLKAFELERSEGLTNRKKNKMSKFFTIQLDTTRPTMVTKLILMPAYKNILKAFELERKAEEDLSEELDL